MAGLSGVNGQLHQFLGFSALRATEMLWIRGYDARRLEVLRRCSRHV